MKPLAALKERYAVQVNPLRAQRRVELVVLALALLLCLQLAYSALRLSMLGRPEPILPVVGEVAPDAGRTGETVTAEMSAELRARPLFWPERRPLVPEPVVEEAAPQQSAPATALDEVQLVGIFGVGDSAGIIALVQGKKQRILRGEDLSGWTLEVVEPGRVVFSSGDNKRDLVLKPSGLAGK